MNSETSFQLPSGIFEWNIFHQVVYLSALRWNYKQSKQYEISDFLRKVLYNLGFVITDFDDCYEVDKIK